MKILQLLLLLLILVLQYACTSEEMIEESGPEPISITGNLTGIVVDESHQPIFDVLVELKGLTTTTDEKGVFNFVDAIALNTGTLVNIKKEGYYDGFKFTSFQPGENSILKVQLVQKTIIASFQSSEETTINVNGAQLYLPSDIAIRADGSPYSGVINVAAHWYDPTDEKTISNMPGDLRGVDSEGLVVQLKTYGMMTVELTDSSGEVLELKEGMTATMSFPLPENANGPDQIPMWHLDETTGVWVEEGFATKVGTAMVADVSHFSFWNCDEPFDVINLKGRIVSIPGDIPINGLQVVITDVDQMISGYGYTNNNGIFSGKVPQGTNLSMSLFTCGELETITDLGILNEDIDLGNIILDLGNQLNLNATLVDCSGETLEEGFALIATDGSLDIAVTNSGQINHVLSHCASGDGTFQAYANDYSNTSDELSFDLEEPFVDLGTVEVCDDSVMEGITFSFQGDPPTTISDVLVSLVDDTYLIIYAEGEEDGGTWPKSIHIRYFINGASLPHVWSQDQIIVRGKFNGINYGGSPIDDPVVAANNLNGLQVGDYVYGVIDNHPTENFSMVYNVKIDQVVNTSQVTGHVWMDSNGDGIREAGEDDPIPSGMSLYVSPINNQGANDIYYFHTEVNPDGSYCIKGLAKDIEYIVWAGGASSDFQVTSYQEGTDPTIDNDFTLSWDTGENVTNVSSPFTLGDEEILPNIGLGLKK